MKLVIQGNVKVGHEVGVFNIPAKKTCRPTEWCLFGRHGKPACYALRNNFLLPSAKKAAKLRLGMSRQKEFVDRISCEIFGKYRYFRIHSSGDFYSKKYINKWIQIIENCPDTLFRTTTRRTEYVDLLHKMNGLPNMIVRESLDTHHHTPIMKLRFAALSSVYVAQHVKTFKCKNRCKQCNYHCWKHNVDVSFDEH